MLDSQAPMLDKGFPSEDIQMTKLIKTILVWWDNELAGCEAEISRLELEAQSAPILHLVRL
jgi:hypothetical protein